LFEKMRQIVAIEVFARAKSPLKGTEGNVKDTSGQSAQPNATIFAVSPPPNKDFVNGTTKSVF
jgi:hypothetical protein